MTVSRISFSPATVNAAPPASETSRTAEDIGDHLIPRGAQGSDRRAVRIRLGGTQLRAHAQQLLHQIRSGAHQGIDDARRHARFAQLADCRRERPILGRPRGGDQFGPGRHEVGQRDGIQLLGGLGQRVRRCATASSSATHRHFPATRRSR